MTWAVTNKLKRCARSPFCKSSGFSHTDMDVDNLVINIGPFTSKHCRTVLEVKSAFFINKIAVGSTLVNWVPAFVAQTVIKAIWFEPPEEEGAPLRLNLIINDANHAKVAWIDNNVWHGFTKTFDINIVSGKERSEIKVTEYSKKVVLDLEFFPPNKVNVYSFSSYYGGRLVEIAGNKEEGVIKINNRVFMSGSGIYSGNSNVALSL